MSLFIADYRRISLQNTVVDAPTWSVTGCKKQRCRMFPPRASSIVVAVPAAPLLIFLSVSLSESLLRVLRALRSPHTRCSFPQTASVGRRVFKVGVTKRKKTESPLARLAGLVISTNALSPEEDCPGKKEPWGPQLVDQAPYFFRDSRQQRELGRDGWADGARNGQMGRCWLAAGLIWLMICSMRQPL